MAEIVLATLNRGKWEEFKNLIGERRWQVFSLHDFPDIIQAEETGKTFRENAQIKAVSAARNTGMVAVADDSGLEVDYLNGLPGVHSARFAGVHGNDAANNEKLLTLLQGVPEAKRTARFISVIAIVRPDGEIIFCQGVCEGMIGIESAGSGGFGYDPLFWVPQFGRTMAELTLEEKNIISHRGKAFRAALPLLDLILGEGING